MIPNKSSFKFQELTPITGVKPYVIRFWETEFEEICPINSDSGQKIYSRKDVEAILKIKKLLFDEKMSIAEAKIAVKNRDFNFDSLTSPEDQEHIDEKMLTRSMILEALNLIKEIKSKHQW
jgi:DNA-binding transcriptional MerR regulator